MYSVTQRVEMIKQPRGGYLKTGMFVREEFDDGIKLNGNENVAPSIVGMVVDYLTRYMCGCSPKQAFSVSLLGAKRLDAYNNTTEEVASAYALIDKINGLSDESIISACQLVRYDVCVRASCKDYIFNEMEPDEYAISNIRNMVNRSLEFLAKDGNTVRSNITFEGGYTEIISTGDADYLTQDALWDMKVSKHELNAEYTLQLLVYYLMGLRSDPDLFEKVKKIGFFNPRKNICYWIDISFIPQSVISVVSREVIGYE